MTHTRNKIQRYLSFKNNPALAQMLEFDELKKIVMEMCREYMESYLGKVMKEMSMIKGDKGDKGDLGWQPTQEEIDTWTKDIFEAVKAGIVVPKDGYTPIKGKDYFDGVTPVKGNHYFTQQEIKEISDKIHQKMMSAIPSQESTNMAFYKIEMVVEMKKMIAEKESEMKKHVEEMEKEMPQKIARGIENLPLAQKLDWKTGIKNKPSFVKESKKAVARGGGDSIYFLDISSSTDGVTKTFTVPYSRKSVILCSDFPSVLMEGNGFSLDSTRTSLTFTTDNAPSSGSQTLYQYVP